MRACGNGKKEIATILYHWNSAAVKIRNRAGQTCSEVAGLSSCPEFKEELDKMEEQKRLEKLQPLLSKKESEVIFVKPPVLREKKSKSFMRAPSLEGHLHIPHRARRSQSPLGTCSSSLRITNLREGSPAGQREEPTPVIRLRLRKQPSVDSGINLDVSAVKNMQKDIFQLSKKDRSLSLPSTGLQRAAASLGRPAWAIVSGERSEARHSPLIDVETISSDDKEQSLSKGKGEPQTGVRAGVDSCVIRRTGQRGPESPHPG